MARPLACRVKHLPYRIEVQDAAAELGLRLIHLPTPAPAASTFTFTYLPTVELRATAVEDLTSVLMGMRPREDGLALETNGLDLSSLDVGLLAVYQDERWLCVLVGTTVEPSAAAPVRVAGGSDPTAELCIHALSGVVPLTSLSALAADFLHDHTMRLDVVAALVAGEARKHSAVTSVSDCYTGTMGGFVLRQASSEFSDQTPFLHASTDPPRLVRPPLVALEPHGMLRLLFHPESPGLGFLPLPKQALAAEASRSPLVPRVSVTVSVGARIDNVTVLCHSARLGPTPAVCSTNASEFLRCAGGPLHEIPVAWAHVLIQYFFRDSSYWLSAGRTPWPLRLL